MGNGQPTREAVSVGTGRTEHLGAPRHWPRAAGRKASLPRGSEDHRASHGTQGLPPGHAVRAQAGGRAHTCLCVQPHTVFGFGPRVWAPCPLAEAKLCCVWWHRADASRRVSGQKEAASPCDGSTGWGGGKAWWIPQTPALSLPPLTGQHHLSPTVPLLTQNPSKPGHELKPGPYVQVHVLEMLLQGGQGPQKRTKQPRPIRNQREEAAEMRTPGSSFPASQLGRGAALVHRAGCGHRSTFSGARGGTSVSSLLMGFSGRP